VHFRGALIAAMVERGHKVFAAAPAISAEVAERLKAIGAEPREFPLVNASLNPLAMLRSLREVRRLIRRARPDVVISYTIKPVISEHLREVRSVFRRSSR
jgi:UDP-N-acetylglucosamine:LPS N-acetylglucosamine transferase